jgi:glycosyltransferase involved in cell wall biosynthesis
MRLCLLAEASSTHTRRWAEHFVARGDEVLVLSLRPGAIAGARVVGIAPAGYGRAGYPLGWPRAWAAVLAFRPQILHAHYATSYGLIGAMLGWRPYVVSVWGSDVTGRRARTPLGGALLRFVFGRADAVCATSRFLADVTRQFVRPTTGITITPFGVDTARFRPRGTRRAAGPLVAGTVRQLWPIYGLDRLLEAFARLPDPDTRLVLIGEGGERDALARKAVGLGVAARVDLAGWVPHDRLPSALRELDVFVMPSLVPEAFGVAAVEAAATGLPVIASATGGLPEVVVDGETGYLVPPGDIGALVERMEYLAADPDLRARMGAAGRRLVLERYEWRHNAAVMEALYDQLSRCRGPRIGGAGPSPG